MNMDSTVDDYCSDDDEVVHEVDVYLSKALSEHLYLFHYPTRNNTAAFQDLTDCLSARIKPKQQKIELEFCIDVDSENYDTSRGEHIAYNVDGQNTTEDHYFKSGIMDKNLLMGSRSLESNDNYAVGFMKNGELHITPLHSTIEMRPGFLHMDKFDNTSKKALNPDENIGEEEEAVAVTVRFEGPNAERDRQMRQKSFQYFQQKNSSEPWMNLNYHKSGSIRSVSERERLMCSQVHQDVCRPSASKLDYLKELVPEILRLSGTQSGKNEETAILTDKPLSDQIRHLMMNAHLLTFSMLEERLPHDIDTLSIERLLPQIGVLVQGCWAVKSELLYEGEKTVSAYTGVSAKHLINARNYILWLFKKARFVTHSDVLSVIRLSDEDFKAMMTPLANKTNRGWEFKFPTDEEFLENHPAIRQSQDMKWDCRYKQLVQDLKMFQSEGNF
ncbi:DNA-directed RNA polymerase III subunit RPC5 [Trichonephila clavata]|uniref:DNA-directed RNA polymerase III subunit RPC5 n=1 Tax=Trichonephila clavata TaxID=2740835 RepID=A0A8X6GFP6_TRICU|nr:DNA-directed RNA polymerase III subunit RPC5 [Trichonephila clavata]